MLKNFLITASRNIRKYKAYSFINFIGLTLGIALALLIMAYVRSELSYDRFHEKADRLYRLRYVAPNGLELATSPPPIAPLMKDFFPEVEEAGRMYGRNVSISLPGKGEAFEETDIYFADSVLMRMFTIEFVRGNPQRALQEKFTVLLNEEMAKKYFGENDPIGETLLFAGKPFKVTGVVKNFPENSHIRFNMLVPYDNMFDLESEQAAKLLRDNLSINFVISHSYTYVLLKPGADPANVDRNMDALLEKHALPNLRVGQVFTLMPLTDIHLKSTLLAEPSATNSITDLLVFIGVGILTLIIAAINYVNLSTAQSFTRVREIGIRKVLGSSKSHLIVQFLAESFLFCVVALVLAYGVFYIALPLMNELTNKNLVFEEVVDTFLLLSSLGIIVVLALMAGGYPAYFVASFNSINSIKGEVVGIGSKSFMRKMLVVFQLGIACTLLSGSMLMMKQMDYLYSRPLGFVRENVVNIPLFSTNLNGIFRENDSTFQNNLRAFRNFAEAQAGVLQTTLSSNPPGLGVTYRGTVPEGFAREDNLFIANMSVDYDFMETFGMELVAGRTFNRDFGTDENEAFIVNETAVQEFHWETPETALGKTIIREGKQGKVIGVIRDFHFLSLTTPVSAMVLEVDPTRFNSLSVRFSSADSQPVVETLEAEWNKLFPEKAFEFNYLDEQINRQYENYSDFSTIIQIFTVLAILISCLGVYGLVLFTVQRRVKEIGVRKVLGAGVVSILRLIYTDFAILAVIGFLIGAPISWYLMNKWLNNFTYHTSIDALTYVISFLIVMLVVAITIGYEAIKASLANPVSSLRSE